MRLMINDYVKLNHKGEDLLLRVVKISASNGQITFCEHNEANVDARNREKSNSFAYIYKSSGSLKTSDAINVAVNPIGKVVRLIN